MKQLQTIIRTNERAATALGHPYITQLSNVYVDLLSVYKAYSEMINTQVAANPQNLFTSNVRAMRAVKKETLRLLDTFIEKSEDNDVVLTKLVPPLLDPVLGDYVRSTPDARDPEVLSLFTCLINKVQAAMTQEVPRVFDAVFKCTLEMITKNFEDNPEHRANLFNLLRAINHHCFPALLTDQGNFTLIIESIKWAFKHTERNVADTGLNTLLELLQNIQQSAFSNAFHQQYYLGLLQDVFAVLTDTLHKPGFKLQAIILSHLFLAVEDGASAHQITSPLWPQVPPPPPPSPLLPPPPLLPRPPPLLPHTLAPPHPRTTRSRPAARPAPPRFAGRLLRRFVQRPVRARAAIQDVHVVVPQPARAGGNADHPAHV